MTIFHPTIIAEAGARDRRIPAFLSRNQFRCLQCGRIEYGNVNLDRVKMCSMCLMGLCMGKQENFSPEANQEVERPKSRILWRMKPERICERCGESFRGRCNRQRFCDSCQRGVRNDRQRKLMAKRRKVESLVSV